MSNPEAEQHWGQLGVFDLETTGIDVDTARIVSACIAILSAEGRVVARWDWVADPGVEIPEGASAVHGITTERARSEGRAAQEVIAEIAQTLRVLFALGTPLVVYNAPYDLTLLDRECRRHLLEPLHPPIPVIDPLVLDKAVDRYRKGKRTLEATAELYGVPLDDAHDAGSDAIAAGRVAQALASAFPEELDVPMADLHGRQEIWYAEQAASFGDYIRRMKGDDGYLPDTAWPVRPLEYPTSVLDTQPIPIPAPRPSFTVPHLDFDTGRLELDSPLGVSQQFSLDMLPVRPAIGAGSDGTAPHAAEPGDPDSPSRRDAAASGAREDSAGSPWWASSPPAQPVRPTPDWSGAPGADEQRPAAPSAPVSSRHAAEATESAPDDLPSSPVGPPSVNTPSTGAPRAGAPRVTRLADAPPPAASRPTVLRIAAGIIMDAAGRTLLVRKRGSTAFMQAGGTIEHGESALAALTRELREEIGLVLDPDLTEYIGSFRAVAGDEPDTVIRAEVFALSTTLGFLPSGEIEEVIWLDTDEPTGIELAPLTRDTVLPLWIARRSALF